MLLAAQYKAVSASSIVVSGRGRVLGYSLNENAGTPAAAVATFYDGVATTAPAFYRIPLAASGAVNFWLGPQGIQFRNGFYFDMTSGSMQGTVYFITEELVGRNIVEQDNGLDATYRLRMIAADIASLFERYV